MGKIFVIVGKSCSGKSTIAKDIAEQFGIEHIISYTTRKPREGEVQGVDYHFTTHSNIEQERFICREQYEVKPTGFQKYAVYAPDLETNEDVAIVLTPSGYRELKERYGDRVVGIYIMASEKVRFNRYISRDPNDPAVKREVYRRLERDAIDFWEFEFEVEYLVSNNDSYDKALEDAKLWVVVEGF